MLCSIEWDFTMRVTWKDFNAMKRLLRRSSHHVWEADEDSLVAWPKHVRDGMFDMVVGYNAYWISRGEETRLPSDVTVWREYLDLHL